MVCLLSEMDSIIFMKFLIFATLISCAFAAENWREFHSPARLLQPLYTEYRQVSSGSPYAPHPRAQAALTFPQLTLYEVEDLLGDIRAGIQFLFQTKNKLTIGIMGTGTMAAHAIFDNLIEQGDKVLILGMGHWSDIQEDICRRLRANVVHLKVKPGTRWYLPDIKKAIKAHRPEIVAMVRGDSSTGVHQPMEGIGEACRKYGALLVVDHVAYAGYQPVEMDRLGIDAIYINQKPLSGVSGVSGVSLSPRAEDKIYSRKSLPTSWQTDFKLERKHWDHTGPNDKGHPFTHTVSVPILYSLREALAAIAEEGLENIFQRHADAHEQMVEGLEALGLTHYVKRKEDMLRGTITMYPPKGKDSFKIVNYLRKNHHLEVSPGFGPSKGKVLRIVPVGTGATPQKVNNVLVALKGALDSDETNV